MNIRIPRPVAAACDRVVGWLAVALLPPPIHTGLVIRGFSVTLTEVGPVAWALVLAAIFSWYYANPWWGVGFIGTMIGGWIMMPYDSPPPGKDHHV